MARKETRKRSDGKTTCCNAEIVMASDWGVWAELCSVCRGVVVG